MSFMELELIRVPDALAEARAFKLEAQCTEVLRSGEADTLLLLLIRYELVRAPLMEYALAVGGGKSVC